MQHTIELRDVLPVKAAGVRFHSDLDHIGDDMSRAFAKVFAVVGRRGASAAGPPLCAYPDDDFDPNSFDAVAAVPVDREVDDDGVQMLELEGGSAVVCTAVGAYDGLPEAWRDAWAWTAERGLRVKATPYEVYRVDMEQAATSESLETDLVIPVG